MVLCAIINNKFQKGRSEDNTDNKVLEEKKATTVDNEPSILYQTNEITIYSLFPSDVSNPDCAFEFGENVASIQFTNTSGTYMENCEIRVVTSDGEEYVFSAQDIPADMEVIAFDTSNKTLTESAECQDISCTTELGKDDLLMGDQVELEVEETQITITNIGGNDLSNLVVTCHCLLDSTCFGGSPYEYFVNELSVGQTATINAEDCYMGQASVVKMTAD